MMENPLKKLTKNKKGRLKLNKLFEIYKVEYYNFYKISKLLKDVEPIESKLINGRRDLKYYPIIWEKDRITYDDCYKLIVIDCNTIELEVMHKSCGFDYEIYKVTTTLSFIFKINILTNDYFIDALYEKIRKEQEILFYYKKKKEEEAIINQNTIDFINNMNS